MCPNFDVSDSKTFKRCEKIILKSTWCTKKFHNCPHTNDEAMHQSRVGGTGGHREALNIVSMESSRALQILVFLNWFCRIFRNVFFKKSQSVNSPKDQPSIDTQITIFETILTDHVPTFSTCWILWMYLLSL